MRIAVVHHWFVTRGGGERVAECIAALFPRAELFTLVRTEAATPVSLRGRTWHTSFLDKLPFARTHHRHFLPLYPQAAESLDLRGFDLVLSSDSGPVKGVRVSPEATHLCYCHSPMRYLWDGYDEYRRAMGPLTRAAFELTAPRVRTWDKRAAAGVTQFVTNSEYVRERIWRCYGRRAKVIPPPIDTRRADGARAQEPGDHYLCAGRLVSYKRTDVLISACLEMKRPLRIAGTGPELKRLRAQAKGSPLIEFLGELSDEALWREYASCRALLFAADEDFGMVPLEAQACGRPVIAYGAGGSLETVPGVGANRTGVYFEQQTAASVAGAVMEWEERHEAEFEPERARAWAEMFRTPLFLARYRDFVLAHAPRAAAECRSVEEAMEVLS